MAQIVRRIIGADFDGNPIYAPKHAHSLLLAAAGGGKTTCGAVPWLQSLIADHGRAIVIADSKEGELAAQCIPMCLKHGRKVALVDPFGVLGRDNPHRISLNPFGAVIAAYIKENKELVFSTENATQALIEEPPKDQRNSYFREEPRTLIEFVLCSLLSRNPRYATPGGVWAILSDPAALIEAAELEAEEGDIYLRSIALHVLGMTANEEHWPQHRAAALKAIRIYSGGSALHDVGVDATSSHGWLIRDRRIIFLIGPVRHMERLGSDYALQLQSFMEVVLSNIGVPVSFILDEFTNAPLKALIGQLTTMRGYGGTCHMIAQSRSEIQRKYGEKETLTIDENSVIKQWFGFSSIQEAELVSRAMGETLNVSASIGINSDRQGWSANLSNGKERLMTVDELMRLPSDEQIIHVKDVGWIRAKKVRQNEIMPYAADLADNPLEGGRLEPEPKYHLDPTPKNKPDDDDAEDEQ